MSILAAKSRPCKCGFISNSKLYTYINHRNSFDINVAKVVHRGIANSKAMFYFKLLFNLVDQMLVLIAEDQQEVS